MTLYQLLMAEAAYWRPISPDHAGRLVAMAFTKGVL